MNDQADLTKLTYAQLRELLQRSEAALAEKRAEELKVLADGYAKKLAAGGFSVQEGIDALRPYLPSGVAKPGSSARDSASPTRSAKYANPENADGFEVFCCLLWGKQGYQTFVTPKRGGDGGVDVVALKGREGQLLQCKSSKTAEVGWDAIKDGYCRCRALPGAVREDASKARCCDQSGLHERCHITSGGQSCGTCHSQKAGDFDGVPSHLQS